MRSLFRILVSFLSVQPIAAEVCTIYVEHKAEEEVIEAITNGLWDYNAPYIGREDRRFVVHLRNGEGQVVGGVVAAIRSKIHMLYIDIVWIHESYRHLGYGTKLMLLAEAEGIKQGCTHAQLETLPFQAEEFYEKLGYCRIGLVEKLYGEYDYIFMRKDLISRP